MSDADGAGGGRVGLGLFHVLEAEDILAFGARVEVGEAAGPQFSQLKRRDAERAQTLDLGIEGGQSWRAVHQRHDAATGGAQELGEGVVADTG